VDKLSEKRFGPALTGRRTRTVAGLALIASGDLEKTLCIAFKPTLHLASAHADSGQKTTPNAGVSAPPHARRRDSACRSSDGLPALELSENRLRRFIPVALLGDLVNPRSARGRSKFPAGLHSGFLAGALWHDGKFSCPSARSERHLCLGRLSASVAKILSQPLQVNTTGDDDDLCAGKIALPYSRLRGPVAQRLEQGTHN